MGFIDLFRGAAQEAALDDTAHYLNPAVKACRRGGGVIEARYDSSGFMTLIVRGKQNRHLDNLVAACGIESALRLLQKSGVPVALSALKAAKGEGGYDVSEIERHVEPVMYEVSLHRFGRKHKGGFR
jgi:hypothetical protein